MAAETHSFIDIAAMEDVRGHFAAGNSLVILTTDLAQIIWCNGPGAAMLGFTGIEVAIGAESGLSRPAKRQVEGIAGYPDIGKDRPVTVRLAAGLISQTTPLRISAIMLPGDEAAIMLVSPAAHPVTRGPGDTAAYAISGFEEAGNYLALLGEDAGVLAATEGFERLGLGRRLLETLVADAAREGLLKRIVRAGGQAMPVGLTQLTDAPPRFLLITVDETAADVEDAAAPLTVVDDSQGIRVEDALAGPDPNDTGAATAVVLPSETAGHDEQQSMLREEIPVGETGREEARSDEEAPEEEAAEDEAPGPPGITESAGPAETQAQLPKNPQHDTWYFSDRAASGKSTDATPINPDSDSAPVRFVWRTDAEGRFSAISPEFSAAVGSAAGELIGRSFEEVAQRLALDPEGEIAGLLARRDTWSGRSVFWPIAGTDLKAPVDLAALPAYDRDRRFEGFRGFGVVRVADAVIDPNGTGMAIVGPWASETQPQQEVPLEQDQPIPADPFEGEVPALEIAAKPQRRFSDKVIRLAEHRQPAGEKGLTPVERTAFREIGEHLKRTSGPSGTDLAEAPDAAAQSSAEILSPEEVAEAIADDVPVLPEQPETEAARTDAPPDQVSPRVVTATDAPDWFVPYAPAVADAADSAPLAPTEPSAGPPQDGVAAAIVEVSGGEAAPVAEIDTRDGLTGHAAESSDSQSATGGTEIEAPVSDTPTDTTQPNRVSRSLLDFAAPDTADDPEAKAIVTEESSASDTGEAFDEQHLTTDATEPENEALPLVQHTVPPPGENVEKRADTSILALLPIPILIHAGDTLHYANDAFLALTGYESIEQLGEAGGIDVLLSGPAADRSETDNRVLLKTRSGEEFPINAFLRSVPWLGGKALLLTLVRPPASSTAPEDEMLRERMSELRTILDTATDGVVLIGNDGMVRSISRPAEALFGYDDDQLVGKPFASLFAIESQRAARDYLSGLADNGVASVLNDGREVIGREAQGRFIPLFMTMGRLPGNSGYCAVLRDITQWKRAEEELTQARAQAERVSSQKSDFLARVSHEIRTPLNAIIGFSELMLDEKFGPVANDRYRDYLRDINRSGNHVLDLVNDLLDISKIEAGQQEMDYQAVALNDALGETVAMMQPQANRERVIIRSSFASKLPEVVADLRSVRQIALNILSNAVRYTQAGGQVIVSTAHEPNGEVIMRVRDTGVGMTQAEIEQALKPFKQVNALMRARGDGTGLGLPLTKAMVEANRAKFAIYSTPGEGTLVEVSFPSTRVLAQ